MTSHTARLRALYAPVFAVLCLLALGGNAGADDTTTTPPRAVPLARSIPQAFGSYEVLLKTAGAVANDQVSLYLQLQQSRTEHALAETVKTLIFDPRVRGGLIRTETNVSDEPALAALRAGIAANEATQAQLIANGATTVPPASTWQRPLAGEISQAFGPTDLGLEPPRIYKGAFSWHFHEGVDILALRGTAIVAPARGRVVFAGRMGDGAEVVVLAHDSGLVSLYAHLDDGPLAPTVKAGDIVQAGDRIGAVGLTGLTTGYHLHWAVYQNGEPIDPLGTLAAP
jgi:murein DD-endopeptidase MepM/ murein hydrolase activator NlpD